MDAPGLPPDGTNPGDGLVPIDGDTADAAWMWQPLIANFGDVNGGAGGGYEIDGCPHAGSSTTCTMPSYSTACAQIPITSEMWIDGFRPGSNGVSDLANDFQSDVPTDDHRLIMVSRSDEGCGTTEQSYTWHRDDEIVYAAGLGSNAELALPHGTAVHLTPMDAQGHPLSLVIFDRLVNYFNTTPMYGTSQVEAHVVQGPTDGLQAVDMVIGGEGTFALAMNPAGPPVPVDGHCTPIGSTSGYQWNIVAFWPHMHASGTHSKVSLSAGSDGTLTPLYDADYTYQDEQTHILDTPVTLGYNDSLLIECDIRAQAQALSYGEVAPEKDWGRTVCWTGIYKYPPGTDTTPGTPTGPETCLADNGTAGFTN